MNLPKRILYNDSLNIEIFSKMIGENWNISHEIFKNYILANISISMTKNSEMKKDINKLYDLDEINYYKAVKNSSCGNHVIITGGTLEQEIQGRKVLGLLLIAEQNYNLRNTMVNLLRKHYPIVFNAVKKHNKKELAIKYFQLDKTTRKINGRLEAAVYFYFSIYRSVDAVDHGFIKSIINDLKSFEFYNPITRDISKELELHKSEIKEIKTLLKREYGRINSYKDILNINIKPITELSSILENFFIINKLDINLLFSESNYINIDEILLAYIKAGNTSLDPKIIIQTIVNGIFIKSLIKEYKKSKDLYFENNQETLLIKIDSLQKKLNIIEKENKDFLYKIALLDNENINFKSILNNKICKLNKENSLQLSHMQNKINHIEKQLLSEKAYRNELNTLREYIFKVNNDYIPSPSKNTLEYYIKNKNIIIIGGTKEWRRKFRENYPTIRSLNGFIATFDVNILAQCDYVFFYTGYMDHATYYKAINFIRSHKIKFGYIGKTNIDLVEEEIIDELEKLVSNDIKKRRLNDHKRYI